MQLALWDPVDPTLLGSLDSTMLARVNGEVYRFGSLETKRQFEADPALYCGLLRDPVTARRFSPSTRNPRFDWYRGPYIFESESTKVAFLADPLKYEVNREY